MPKINDTLNDILNRRNINGEIYRCDVKIFFNIWDDSKKVDQLHKALTKMANATI